MILIISVDPRNQLYKSNSIFGIEAEEWNDGHENNHDAEYMWIPMDSSLLSSIRENAVRHPERSSGRRDINKLPFLMMETFSRN